MKKIGRIAMIAMFLTVGSLAMAQDAPQDWQSRMRSERIAFLTTEVGLTPQEAQAFWPVYNKADEEKTQAFEAVMKAFRELDKAVREKKSEAEISKLLNTYTSAVNATQGIDAKYISDYKKIISAQKVAKLLIAEERFRNNQIYRLQRPAGGPNGAPNGGPNGGQRPGQGFRGGQFPTPRAPQGYQPQQGQQNQQ